jgi:hypothetical protein
MFYMYLCSDISKRRESCEEPPPKKKNGQHFPCTQQFLLPPSHSPWGMKRNVEREKEEVLVRLIYKKT